MGLEFHCRARAVLEVASERGLRGAPGFAFATRGRHQPAYYGGGGGESGGQSECLATLQGFWLYPRNRQRSELDVQLAADRLEPALFQRAVVWRILHTLEEHG